MNSEMTEDDTFKMLKSISHEEAMAIFHNEYDKCLEEAQGAGIKIEYLRNKIDPILKPYGWSFDRLFPFYLSVE